MDLLQQLIMSGSPAAAAGGGIPYTEPEIARIWFPDSAPYEEVAGLDLDAGSANTYDTAGDYPMLEMQNGVADITIASADNEISAIETLTNRITVVMHMRQTAENTGFTINRHCFQYGEQSREDPISLFAGRFTDAAALQLGFYLELETDGDVSATSIIYSGSPIGLEDDWLFFGRYDGTDIEAGYKVSGGNAVTFATTSVTTTDDNIGPMPATGRRRIFMPRFNFGSWTANGPDADIGFVDIWSSALSNSTMDTNYSGF